jgi:hypothetical protein
MQQLSFSNVRVVLVGTVWSKARSTGAAAIVVLPGLITMILANPAEPADAFRMGRLACCDGEILSRCKFPVWSFYCHVLSLPDGL